MAVDLAAIRKKLAALNGQRSDSSVQLWKPGIGTYRVRGIPWKNAPEGLPFLERRILYIGENRGFLAPEQFGKPDPVADLRRKLFSSKDPGDREIAKKLMPKTKAYMPIIVRGEEGKGVQVWAFTNYVEQRLLSFYTDEDLGNIDILDPEAGFDLKVTLTKSGKVFNGKEYPDTTIDPVRTSSKLSDDPKQLQAWLDGVPNIDSMWQDKTEADIRKMLDAWVNGPKAPEPNTDGTARGTDRPVDELDRIASEVKAEPKKVAEAAAAEAKPKRANKKADIDDEDAAPTPKKSLDDAFNELMTDDT
jgi:hypothetical protein